MVLLSLAFSLVSSEVFSARATDQADLLRNPEEVRLPACRAASPLRCFLNLEIRPLKTRRTNSDQTKQLAAPLVLSAKPNAGLLNLLILQKPYEGFVVEINDINPVAEWVPESTPKS
jgi:hypothetical protein